MAAGAGATADSMHDGAAAGIDVLGEDCLTLILAQAHCGWTLARAQLVCSRWNAVATQEELWQNAVHGRWRMLERARSRAGKCAHGDRSWREIWRVFHRRRRMPHSAGISLRAVAHARGFSGRLGAWFLVNHQPACRLISARDGGGARLSCKLLLQNLRTEGICIRGGTAGLRVSLQLRDGRVLFVEQVGWAEALPPSSCSQKDAPSSIISPPPLLWALPPSQCMVVELIVHTGAEMLFEPDVLEACHAFVVTLPQTVQISCRFEGEDTLWAHYEQINSTFYVHHEHELP
jgi:hypothetical protein